MPVRNVIFDFGGVLVKWAPAEFIARFYEDPAVQAVVWETVFQHPDWIEWDRGTLDDQAAAQRFAGRAGRTVDEMNALLGHMRQSLTPITETVAILHELDAAGIPLYGLSNMPASTFAFLRARDPHWSVFRGIVISGEIKMIKPDPEIFEHITRLYNLTPAETLFIDDSKPNIETAQRLGFHTIHFQGASHCGAEIRRLLKR
jgi:putative hydrolase of the HAD superfamily